MSIMGKIKEKILWSFRKSLGKGINKQLLGSNDWERKKALWLPCLMSTLGWAGQMLALALTFEVLIFGCGSLVIAASSFIPGGTLTTGTATTGISTPGISLPGSLIPRIVEREPVFSFPQALNSNAAQDSEDDTNPRIATDKNGNWVAVWQRNNKAILAATSTNGSSWSSPITIVSDDTPSITHQNARIATDEKGHWVIVWHKQFETGGEFPTLTDTILVSRSTNNGKSWTSPAPLYTDNKGVNFKSVKEIYPQIATDGKGHWVAVWDNDVAQKRGDKDILVSRSVDILQTG